MDAANDTPRCETCQWGEHQPSMTNIKQRVYRCIRFPPGVFAMPVPTPQGPAFVPSCAFPMMEAEQRCGEWTPQKLGSRLAQ